MIVDDYPSIAEQLKRIQKEEMRQDLSVQNQQEMDDLDDQLIGNEEETGCGYHDVYCG